MNLIRQKRLEKRILVLVTDVFLQKVQDNIQAFVTFTRCSISSDVGYAKIYFSIYGAGKHHGKISKQVKSIAPLIRTKIAKNIRTKKIPFVQLEEDQNLIQQDRISQLLDV